MNKYLLLGFVLMFLLVNVSAGMSYTPPLDAVTNVNVVNETGGLIPKGYYYIAIIASDKDSLNYVGAVKSPVVFSEINISTDNQTLNITWDDVPNAIGYSVYLSTVGNLPDRWYNRRLMNGRAYNQLTTLSSNLFINNTLESSEYSGYAFDGFAIHDELALGINKSLGEGKITISDSVGDIYLQDLADLIGNTDYFQFYGHWFIGTVFIDITSNASGTLHIDSAQHLTLFGGTITDDSSSFSVDIEEGAIIDVTPYAQALYLDGLVENSIFRGGIAYNTYYTGYTSTKNSFYLAYSSTLQLTSTMTGGDNTVLGLRPTLNNNVLMDGWKVIDASLFMYPPKVNVMVKNVDVSDSLVIRGNYADVQNVTIKDSIFGKNVAVDVSLIYIDTDFFSIYDLEFPSAPSNDEPRMQYYLAGHGLKIYHSLNLTIKDSSGNSLSDSNVLLYNNTGGLVLNVTTDSSGNTENYIQSMLVTQNASDEGYYVYTSFYNSSNPFNLLISKDGYSQYNLTFNFTEKKDWTISLSESLVCSNIFEAVIIQNGNGEILII